MILPIQLVLGLLVGFRKLACWRRKSISPFVIGLTIGYGDLVPRQALARVLAIGIGVSGLLLLGSCGNRGLRHAHSAW